MSWTLRTFLLAVAASCSLLLVTAAASALTISPAGAYVDTNAGAVTFTLTSNGLRASCTTFVLSSTIAADGRGTVPLGGLRTAGCTANGVAMAVIHNLPITTQALLNGVVNPLVGRFYVIPLNGIRGGISQSVPGCMWDISGNRNIGRGVIGVLPITVPAGAPFATLSSNITILNVTGVACAALGIRNGLAATATGAFSLDRAVTYSG